MVTWPASPFPQLPLQDDFSETAPDLFLRTPMEEGPVKQRRLYSGNVRPLTVSLSLTSAQVTELDDFYQSTPGAAFTWVNPRTGAAASVRFVSKPKYTNIGGDNYIGRFQAEVLP